MNLESSLRRENKLPLPDPQRWIIPTDESDFTSTGQNDWPDFRQLKLDVDPIWTDVLTLFVSWVAEILAYDSVFKSLKMFHLSRKGLLGIAKSKTVFFELLYYVKNLCKSLCYGSTGPYNWKQYNSQKISIPLTLILLTDYQKVNTRMIL